MKILRHRVSSLRSVNPRIVVALFLVGVFALGAVVLAAGGDESDEGSPNTFDGSLMPKGVPAPDFRLKNQDGKTVTMSSLRGQPVVVTFLYTTCQDSCPIQAQTVRGALDELGHDVPALAIAVDPPRDTPERAQAFLAKQRATGRIDFVLGSRADLRPLWKGYRIRPQAVDEEHMARITLVDSSGFQRIGYPDSEATPERLAHDLDLLEQEAD
jgi:protein SCO1